MVASYADATYTIEHSDNVNSHDGILEKACQILWPEYANAVGKATQEKHTSSSSRYDYGDSCCIIVICYY